MSEHSPKRLIIMRHAKSDWPAGVADFDRPLLPRGHGEAALAGTWLRKHDLVPDVILCSSATRTQQTCAGVLSELGDDAPEAELHDALYAASPLRMLAVINHAPDSAGCVLVIAHMPGVQELVDHLASADSDDDALDEATSRYPTSAFTVLEPLKPWAELDGQDARVMQFVVPRAR
ncbi:histidine phosphatase family protein [Leifsonia kafniensis]|uniref:Histidine phosphatase family protein n=1 Tax=Leifsonia kafniensis TaxID=475957 RepID=A0ABP7K5N0_9MICO